MKKASVIDKYKGSGLSLAEVSEKLAKKYPNRDFDLIQKNSFEKELSELADYQDKRKLVAKMAEAVKEFKKGGELSKYPYGGLLGDPNKKTYSTLEDQPLYTPEVSPMPLFNMNNLGSGLFGTPQMPVNPNQINTLTVEDPQNTQTTDNTILTRDNPITLGNNNTTIQPRGSGEMSAYTPALLGQGLSTILNAGILAQGYDKVAPIDNSYENEVKNLMASRSIDTTQQRNQILSSYNAAKEGLNNVRSSNVRNALDVNLMNVAQDNLASSKLQEQVANAGFKGDYANVLNNLGRDKAQAKTYAEQATAQNKSTFENNLSYFGDLMAQHGESFSAFKANQNMNTALGKILNDKYASSGLGISQDTIDKFNSGKATEQDWIELTAKIKDANPALTIPEFKLK